MRTISTCVLAGLSLLATASSQATAADPFFKHYLSGGTCYLHLYDVTHMRKNPKQTLTNTVPKKS